MVGLLSAGELSRERITGLLAAAADYQAGRVDNHSDRLLGLFFFEESLRTRLGFEAAAARLAVRTVAVSGPKQAVSMRSPERLDDALLSVARWCDAICLRHAEVGSAHRAARICSRPIINCGDGNSEHPTQALVDLFALQEFFGAIDGLTIAFVGDLDGMRTVHSLALALAQFRSLTIRCVSPPGLSLPPRFRDPLIAAGHRVSDTNDLSVEDVDAVYIAGLPAETRVGVLAAREQQAFAITSELVERLPEHAKILCPLPRVDEISAEVDGLPQAGYFRQSQLGVYPRMAVLAEIFASV